MIKQTTLHNILTWVIAVILFIFQSLNYFVAWIKKYVKHGEKTTTVVTADTTISSESNPSNKNAQENVITVQELIQKHFDIPLIIAEDEPKVYNFIKNAQLLTSNEICKEKKKIDKFMENLVDDSYIARGLGLITATVGRQSEFYLYSKYDNNFENIVIKLNGRNGEVGEITILNQNPANIVETKAIPIAYFYDKDRIKVTYTPFAEGVYTLTLVRNSLSICRSPYYISVEKSATNSRSQIRLGTKKYKPVTKFTKAKHLSLETNDNSIPVIELGKSSICKNIHPVSEENSIRTDVMSIVTKFESNSISGQKKVHKHAPSIPEKGSETDLIDDISTYSNIKPKIETDNVYYNNVSDLNSHNAQSKSKSTDNNFWNNVDITYRNRKASDINAIDSESERIKKSVTNVNKNIRITKDISRVKNVSSAHLKSTNSVLEESLNDGNSLDVEKRHQTFKFKTTECTDENTHIETLLDPKTRIDEYDFKCIDNEPCIQNEPSCFDDDDRNTVVVTKNINEIESNPNDTVIQQVTDSPQYNINTPFASIITKISNSVCEKCSLQVLKIISEFPRDINITHDNNSKEIRSKRFETLLAQPISININIDNMFEHPISAANEQNSEHLLNNSPKKIKCMGTTDKDMKCQYLNEIEPIKNNSDELCDDINNPSTELIIKINKPNSEISKTIKDKIIDHCTVPFTENAIDKDKTVDQKNELSTNEILDIKFSKTNEENELTNDSIHKSDNEMEIQGRYLQKSSEHNMGLIKTNQFHKNINRELHNISKQSDRPLTTSDLATIDNDKNINEEPVIDEFKIIKGIIPDKSTNMESSVIDNTVLASMEVTLETSKYNLEHNAEQIKNISSKYITLASTQNENQKLMIEKSIEPVLTSFKNKMVEKIIQLYLNKDLSNTDNTTIVETHDKHLTNNLKENQIHKIANNTEIKTKCIETLASHLKNHIDKNEISEIILDEKKTVNNHLFKYVENIIKTNINSSDIYTQTLGEKKLQTLVNTAMNHPNNQQIGNEFKKMMLDNETQDVKLKKINNGKIVQDIVAILAETQSVPIIKNTDVQTSSKNEVTVKTERKLPLINDFISIERNNTITDIKQEMQSINENGNVTMIETNAEEIKEMPNFQKSHNTPIITPIIELQPILETRILNTSELGILGEHNLEAIQTTIEIIESNIPEETDEIENIDDKKENKSVKLQIKENENVTIKIPHLTEKKTINEILESTSTNISTKSNLTKKQQTKKQEIETLKLKKVLCANDENIEREIIYTSSPLNTAENIFIDKPNPQITPALNEHVKNNEAKLTIGIKTSEPQFSNTTITELIPSKIPIIENNSINPKQRILNTLNKLDAIEILTMPKYSTTCDTKKAVNKLQNASETTLSPKQLYIMKNMMLEKTENTDETCAPNDTEIETLEFLNRCEKMKSIPPFANDTSAKNTMESKTEKNTLQTTFNSKYNLTTIESTVNEISCKNNENETLTQISSMTEEVDEKPIKNPTQFECTPLVDAPNKPDLKVDEMLLSTKPETPGFIGTPTASSVQKIVVEFVAKINKKPIETLAIIVHENIEENIVTAREIPFTMNYLTVVMDEQINIKTNGSDTNYKKVDDKVKTTETKTRISIDRKNAEKIIKKEPEVRQQINSIKEIVVEKTKVNESRESKKLLSNVTSTSSMEEMKEINKIIITLPIKSTIEYLEVSKKMEDTNEIEKKSCTHSSTVAVEESPTAINSSCEVVEEHTKDNIDKENENVLSIHTSYGPVKANNEINEQIETLLNVESSVESTIEESVKYIAVTAVTCNESANVILDVLTDVDKVIGEESSKPINSIREKNIDQEPVPTVNSANEVIAENTKENIDTQKETLIKTSTRLMEELEVIGGTTGITFPMESIMESIDEPKEFKAITETEITKCTKSSMEMNGDQIHADRIVTQESPVESKSSSKVVGKNTTVNINEENKTPLLIKTLIESIELKIKENKTLPAPINSPDEVAGEINNVNIDIENTTPLPIESVFESRAEPIMIEDITETEISCADSSIVIVDAKIDVDEGYDGGTELPINTSDQEVSEKNYMNSDTEKETLLSSKTSSYLVEERNVIEGTADILLPIESLIESIDEPKVVEDIILGTERTLCTETTTEIIGDQKNIDRIHRIDGKEPPLESNSSNEIIAENTIVNIDTENKTPLFIEPIAESKVEENRTGKEILSYTDSSAAYIKSQMNKEKYIENESSDPIHPLNEVVGENSNMNIEVIDDQNHTNRIVDQDPLVESNSLDKVVEDTNQNIDKEKKTILLIDTSYGPLKENNEIDELIETVLNVESTVESTIEESVKYIAVTAVTCTDSANMILDVLTDVDKVIKEESSPQMVCVNEKIIEHEPLIENNFQDQLIAENTNGNFQTEKKTLPIKLSPCLMKEQNVIEGITEIVLPVESAMESTEERKIVDDITATEITSSNEFSTKIFDDQINTEKIVDREHPAPNNSSDELLEENKKENIYTKNEKLLNIGPVIESIAEPGLKGDKTEIKISCSNSFIVTVDAQTKNEKKIEESPAPIKSSDEQAEEKNNVKIDIENTTPLPIESFIESIAETILAEDIIETKISCADSSIVIVDAKIDVDEEMDEGTVVLINSSDEVLGEKINFNIDTETKTTFFNEPTAEPEMEEDKTERKILSFTVSSASNIDTMKKENYIEEESTELLKSSDDVVGKENNANIDKEKEKLLPIDTSSGYEEKNKKINELIETLLPVESTVQSIKETVVDITVTAVTSCTDSSNIIIDVQTDVEKVIVEESSSQIICVGEDNIEQEPLVTNNSQYQLIAENTNGNIHTEKKSLPIKVSSCIMEKQNVIEGITEIILPVQSAMDSTEIRKIVGDITETEITSSTESITEIIDDQINAEKIVDRVHLVPNNSSDELLGGNKKDNIHTKNETLLNIAPIVESIAELGVEEDKTEIKISCSNSSTVTVDVQTKNEKKIEEESLAPINSSDEDARENNNVKIDIENTTTLPIESVIETRAEPIMVENITETEISCADSSIVIVDAKIDVDEGHDGGAVEPIISSDEEVGEKNYKNSDTEKETLLSSKTSSDLVEERNFIEGTTDILLPIESSIESIDEPKVVEDIIVGTERTSCNETTTEIIGDRKHIIDRINGNEPPLDSNSSNEIFAENNIVNIDTGNKTPLFIEPIADAEVEEDKTEKEILSYTDSSTADIEAQINKEKYVEKESPDPINFSNEVVGDNSNMNIEVIDDQNHTDRNVDQDPLVESNSLDKVVEDTNQNIDKEKKTILLIDTSYGPLKENNEIDELIETVLNVESKVESTIEKSVKYIAVTSVTCTDSANMILDVLTDVDKVIGEESSELMNSIGEKKIDQEPPVSAVNSSDGVIQENTNKNIDTERETLLPIKISSCLIEEQNVIDGITEIILPVESTVESTEESKKVKAITETEITSCTESSTKIIDDQIHADRIFTQEALVDCNSSSEVNGKNTTVIIDTENKTPSTIESVLESKAEPIMVEDIPGTEISCADSSIVIVDAKMYAYEGHNGVTVVPINSSDEEVGEKYYMDSDTEKETLLPSKTSSDLVEERNLIEITTDILLTIQSSIKSIDEPKVVDDIIVETEKASCTETSMEIIGDQKYIDRIDGKEPPLESNYSNEIIAENTIVNIDTENKTPLFIEPIAEPEVEKYRTDKEILSYTDSSTADIEAQMNKEKYVEKESPDPINSSNEVVGENSNMNIAVIDDQKHTDRIVDQDPLVESNSSDKVVEDTNENIDTEKDTLLPSKTFSDLVEERYVIEGTTDILLPIEASIEFIDESKVIEDIIVETEITSCTKISTKMIDHQYHTNTNIDQEPLVESNSSVEVVGQNKNVPIGTIMKSLEVSREVEYIYETEKTPCTDFSSVTVDVQTDEEKVIKKGSPTPVNFLTKILGGNTKVNVDTENETLLINESNEESVLERKVEKDTITAVTSCIDSSNVAIDFQIDVENVIGEESSVPIKSLSEVVEEHTNVNIDTENDTVLQIDISKTALKAVTDEKAIENEYSISSFLVAEKQSNIIDYKTDTLSPIETYMTFVDEPNVMGYVSVNEHGEQTDSSTTNLKKQIKIDSETEIETLSLISNLTKSVKEQIVEKITENKTPTLINSSSEIVGQGNKVNIDIDSRTPLPMNTSSTTVDGQIVKNIIENETPIYCLVDVAEEQTKVNIKNNIETFMPIDIFTTSVEEQLNLEYLSENEHTAQIERESGNEISTTVNYSTSITIEQTDVHNVAEKTLPNENISCRNPKTNSIGREIKTENSDNPNNCCLKFEETSKMHSLENEDNLPRKLEMSVQRMKTSDEDNYEKTFLQLEQTEKISKEDNVNVDGENKTIIDEKLYTVNESDLNAILCASSLEEALTLLDSKIKFKFKHKKSPKINSKEYIPKIQTFEGQSSGVNTNFTDAREFFKEIEKKSKK